MRRSGRWSGVTTDGMRISIGDMRGFVRFWSASLRSCEVKQLAASLQATGNSAELGQTPRHGPFSTTAHAGASIVTLQVADAKVLIPTTGRVSAQDINAVKDLRLITNPAAGYNNIAIEAAKARGVPVCTAPGYNAASVAEGALMMMLMLARRVHEQERTFKERGIGYPFGMQLHGKTLGIIGMGAIGTRLARTAEAIGMVVMGLNSKSSRSDLEAMLQVADVVSLHCSLTPKTHHLIGVKEFAMMKKGAFIINYARGDVIHEEALTEALTSGHLGGAGLDVHWVEPANPVDKVYQHPNVIATPHTGVSSTEVLESLAQVVCENIIRQREGRELLHRLC